MIEPSTMDDKRRIAACLKVLEGIDTSSLEACCHDSSGRRLKRLALLLRATLLARDKAPAGKTGTFPMLKERMIIGLGDDPEINAEYLAQRIVNYAVAKGLKIRDVCVVAKDGALHSRARVTETEVIPFSDQELADDDEIGTKCGGTLLLPFSFDVAEVARMIEIAKMTVVGGGG